MGFDVSGIAPLGPTSARPSAPASTVPGRRWVTRCLGWFAVAGLGSSLAVTVATSLGRATWTWPAIPMPRAGPPFEPSIWHLTLASATIGLWLSALAGGL